MEVHFKGEIKKDRHRESWRVTERERKKERGLERERAYTFNRVLPSLERRIHHNSATHCNTLQHTATHYSTLQHTVAHWKHCNSLQHTAAH